MAQTAPHSMATGIVSTPFPPGLSNGASTNAPAQQAEGAASAVSHEDGAVGRRAWLDERSDRQALMDDVRKAVLEEIDAKVAEKMKDLWSKGNTMLKKVEQDNQQKNAKMIDEITQCRLKQDALKADHDHLQAVLAGMVTQFNMLGSMFGGNPVSPKAVSPMPVSVAAGLVAAKSTNGTATPTDAPGSSSASTLQDSPSSFAGGSFPPLPAVPDFPFLPATNAPNNQVATPLSLAEALGPGSSPSPSVPVSLMGSLAASSQHIFSFTLRKADGTDLGLNVSHHEDDKALRVEGVRPEGAVEAWNRACMGSTQSEKSVLPGDRIVSVNGVINNPVKMLEECRDRQLLKLTVVRGEAASAPKPSVALRADASEFVPSVAPGLEAMTESEKAAKVAAKDDADEKKEANTKTEQTSEL